MALRQLPSNVKLSDITFDVKLNEIVLNSDRSIISAYRVNGRTSPNEIAKLINSDVLGLVWIRVKIFDYKYEDASGNPIPTRPERGAFKVTPSKREAYFVIDAKYIEVDDELNIVKLPPFVTEVGLSVYKGPYDTMDLRRFWGGTSSVFNRSSEFYDKDIKMFPLEDSYKKGNLLCQKAKLSDITIRSFISTNRCLKALKCNCLGRYFLVAHPSFFI